MKLDKALQQIFPAETFKNNDLAALLGASGIKDLDIPDEVMTQFPSVYLTKDRAMNDPELIKQYKGQAWANFTDTVEDELKTNIVPKMSDDFKTKYFATPKMYDKLKVVNEYIQHLSEKGGDDVKTLADKHRKQVAELTDKIVAHESTNKKLADDFAAKESGIKINYALRAKLTDKLPKLDPNIFKTEELKTMFIESTLQRLQGEYLLEFDKDKPTSINFLTKDRTDVYEGNKKVSLDDYISRTLEPYTIKNNGGDPPKPDPTKVVVPPSGNGKTIEEMRFAAAGVPV